MGDSGDLRSYICVRVSCPLAHAGDAADPAFKFGKLADLGYAKGFLGIGSDERAFKFLYATLGKYGVSLEQAARDLLVRRERER